MLYYDPGTEWAIKPAQRKLDDLKALANTLRLKNLTKAFDFGQGVIAWIQITEFLERIIIRGGPQADYTFIVPAYLAPPSAAGGPYIVGFDYPRGQQTGYEAGGGLHAIYGSLGASVTWVDAYGTTHVNTDTVTANGIGVGAGPDGTFTQLFDFSGGRVVAGPPYDYPIYAGMTGTVVLGPRAPSDDYNSSHDLYWSSVYQDKPQAFKDEVLGVEPMTPATKSFIDGTHPTVSWYDPKLDLVKVQKDAKDAYEHAKSFVDNWVPDPEDTPEGDAQALAFFTKNMNDAKAAFDIADAQLIAANKAIDDETDPIAKQAATDLRDGKRTRWILDGEKVEVYYLDYGTYGMFGPPPSQQNPVPFAYLPGHMHHLGGLTYIAKTDSYKVREKATPEPTRLKNPERISSDITDELESQKEAASDADKVKLTAKINSLKASAEAAVVKAQADYDTALGSYGTVQVVIDYLAAVLEDAKRKARIAPYEYAKLADVTVQDVPVEIMAQTNGNWNVLFVWSMKADTSDIPADKHRETTTYGPQVKNIADALNTYPLTTALEASQVVYGAAATHDYSTLTPRP